MFDICSRDSWSCVTVYHCLVAGFGRSGPPQQYQNFHLWRKGAPSLGWWKQPSSGGPISILCQRGHACCQQQDSTNTHFSQNLEELHSSRELSVLFRCSREKLIEAQERQETQERRRTKESGGWVGKCEKVPDVLDPSANPLSPVDLLSHQLLQQPLVEVLSHPLAPRIHQVSWV